MSFLISFAYSIAWVGVKRIPEKFARIIFKKIADISYRRDITGVQQLRANLAFLLKLDNSAELELLVRNGMRNYLRYWQDIFALPGWNRSTLNNRFEVKGQNNLDDALKQKLPLVTATPHMGNYDAGGYWYVNNFGPLVTVVERLKPESLYNKFVKFRNLLGVEVIPTQGESDIFMKLLRSAKEGKMVALIADRDITKNGIEVTYAGAATSFPVGPAVLATTLKGLVLPLVTYYENNKIVLEFFPTLKPVENNSKADNVKNITQNLANIFAQEIKKHPEDWHMLQKVWEKIDARPRVNNELIN
jgi:KDO2-lipid IV(A) lauroyltransferase